MTKVDETRRGELGRTSRDQHPCKSVCEQKRIEIACVQVEVFPLKKILVKIKSDASMSEDDEKDSSSYLDRVIQLV